MTEQNQGVKDPQPEQKTDTYEIGSRYQEPTGAIKVVVGILGAALTLFQLYTAQFGLLVSNKQRSVMLAFGLALTFLLFPSRLRKRKDWPCRYPVCDRRIYHCHLHPCCL